MTCFHVIATRMENQWLAVTPFVVLDFAQKDYVIATVKFLDAPTNEMRCGAPEHWTPGNANFTIDAREFVGD